MSQLKENISDTLLDWKFQHNYFSNLSAEVSFTPISTVDLGVQLYKMNLSSGLKLFWQAILKPAKVLEVVKAFPLLSSSASQQVQGLNLRLPSMPLTGLKGRAALLLRLPRYHSQRTGRWCLFIGCCRASGAQVSWHTLTLGLVAMLATTHYVSLHLSFLRLTPISLRHPIFVSQSSSPAF